VVADTALASCVASRHASLLNPASGPAQEALTELSHVGEEYLERARATVLDRIDDLVAALDRTGLQVRRPAGGFYLWIDVQDRVGEATTEDFCVRLARDHRVGLWPGEDFGGIGHVRLAVTAPSSGSWTSAVDALCESLDPENAL
jgi:aspartate/methionine/tyrosine aminotransferase